MWTIILLSLMWFADQATPPAHPLETGLITGVILQVPGDSTDAKATVRLQPPVGTSVPDSMGATLSDLNAFPTVSFTNLGISAGTGPKFIYFQAAVTNIPPVPFTRQRIVILRVGAKAYPVLYILTNQATQSPSLTITLGTSDWSASAGPMPVAVTTADAPATRVQLDAGFTENTSRVPLPANAIELCAYAQKTPCEALDIPPYSTRTGFLRGAGGWRAGVFSGKIALTAVQYKTPVTSNLTIYLSGQRHKWLGILAVVFSVFLSWWVKTWAGNRIARDQALLPVAALDGRLRALADVLGAASPEVGYPCPKLTGALEDWTAKLSVSSLEQNFGLPGPSPSPFQRPATLSGDFTKFLTQADTALTVLQILINGVQQVRTLTASGELPPPKSPVAAKSIDDAYNSTLTSDQAVAAVTAAISAAKSAWFSATAAVSPSPMPSFASLMVEIRRLNTVVWLVMLAVSAVGTILLLVLKSGFGKITDYLLCLTTAFGAPTLLGAAIPAQSVSTTVTGSTQTTSGSPPAKGM
jgi:hypothetical protein